MFTPRATQIADPPLARLLFSDTRLAWLWLPFRLWLGYTWITSGWGKFQNPAWIGDGSGLKSYWERAVVTDPAAVIKFDWYRDFITLMLNAEAYTWFSKVVLFGELAVGVALILGAFTGLAAFGGSFLNWNFIMAGSASTNGLLFAIATLLVLAWKNSGYIGLDRYLLPLLGTPWQPGSRVGPPAEPVVEASTTDYKSHAA